MINKLKDEVNFIRQNIFSYYRKIKLKKETKPSLVEHFKIFFFHKHVWYGNSYGGFYIIPEFIR